MKKVGYFLSTTTTFLWAALLSVWVAFENFYPINNILIVLIFAIVLLISFVFVFMYRYYQKYKNQVNVIKQQYLFSLKPQRPLRMYGYYEPEIKEIKTAEVNQNPRHKEKEPNYVDDEMVF